LFVVRITNSVWIMLFYSPSFPQSHHRLGWGWAACASSHSAMGWPSDRIWVEADMGLRFTDEIFKESQNRERSLGLQIFRSLMPRSVFNHTRQVLVSLYQHVMQSWSPRVTQNWGPKPASRIDSFTTILTNPTILDDQNQAQKSKFPNNEISLDLHDYWYFCIEMGFKERFSGWNPGLSEI
jgi:hypothetical protein